MATIGTAVTLADYAKTLDPDGTIAKVIEILNQTNEMIPDIPWIEGNLDVGHRHTIRSGLPTATWRMLNYGTQPTKGQTKQVDDTCGMLEAVCDIDKKLADLNGNKAAWRFSQDVSHIEGMGQQLATALFYGNQATDPEQITGLAPRFAAGDTAGDSNTSADQLIAAGGTSTTANNTSVWLVNWSPSTVFGIYPKGMKAGLQHEDRGMIDLYDAANGAYRGYRSYYSWDCGLAVADWRNVARLCNIVTANLVNDAATGADLVEGMIKLVHKIRKSAPGKRAFYVNESVYLYLDLQTLNSSNMNVTYRDNPHGEPVMYFRGIPVRMSEALLNTEATVAFS